MWIDENNMFKRACCFFYFITFHFRNVALLIRVLLKLVGQARHGNQSAIALSYDQQNMSAAHRARHRACYQTEQISSYAMFVVSAVVA